MIVYIWLTVLSVAVLALYAVVYVDIISERDYLREQLRQREAGE